MKKIIFLLISAVIFPIIPGILIRTDIISKDYGLLCSIISILMFIMLVVYFIISLFHHITTKNTTRCSDEELNDFGGTHGSENVYYLEPDHNGL